MLILSFIHETNWNSLTALEHLTKKLIDRAEPVSIRQIVHQNLLIDNLRNSLNEIKGNLYLTPLLVSVDEKLTLDVVKGAINNKVNDFSWLHSYFKERLLVDHKEGSDEVDKLIKSIKGIYIANKDNLKTIKAAVLIRFVIETVRTTEETKRGLDLVSRCIKNFIITTKEEDTLKCILQLQNVDIDEKIFEQAANHGNLIFDVLDHLKTKNEGILKQLHSLFCTSEVMNPKELASHLFCYMDRVYEDKNVIIGVLEKYFGVEEDKSVTILLEIADLSKNPFELSIKSTLMLVRDLMKPLRKGLLMKRGGYAKGQHCECCAIISEYCRLSIQRKMALGRWHHFHEAPMLFRIDNALQFCLI